MPLASGTIKNENTGILGLFQPTQARRLRYQFYHFSGIFVRIKIIQAGTPVLPNKKGKIMGLKKGTLMSFNSINYTARVALSGSLKVGLDGVAVARNIASGEMVAGRSVVVFFPDEHNVKEAVVFAVYML